MTVPREFLSSLERLVAQMGAAAPDADALRAEVHRLARLAVATRVDAWLRDHEAADAWPLLARLRREGAVRLVIRQGASVRELAQFAGLLHRAWADPTRPAGPAVAEGLDALGIWGVQLLVESTSEPETPALVPELEAALAVVSDAWQAATVPPAYVALREALALTPERLGDETRAAVVVTLACAQLETRLRERGYDFPPEVLALHWARFDELLAAQLPQVVHAVLARALPDAYAVLRRSADQVVPLLLGRLGEAEGIDERRRCFTALLDAGGGIDTLIEALRDERWYVVRNVALVLGELGARPAVRPLARCLTSSHRRVREAAAEALERMASPSALHALLPALRDPNASVRRTAARAVGAAPLLKVPVSADVIASRLHVEPDLEVALELVASLRALGDAGALTALLRVVTEPDSTPHGAPVRQAAWEAIAAGERTRVRPMLQRLAQSGDTAVRAAARRVLALLDGAPPADARSA